MKIVADSGSTKTAWAVITELGIERFESEGLNPFFRTSDQIYSVVSGLFSSHYSEASEVHFFGAGCANDEMNKIVAEGLRRFFGSASISVDNDLQGAAVALKGSESGVVGILGTGSNLGWYNGKYVEYTIPSLGYVLGDEGAGSFIGKEIVKALMRGELSSETKSRILEAEQMSEDEILRVVYSSDAPNRFLAKFSRHAHDCKNSDEKVLQIVKNTFDLFFQRHVMLVHRKNGGDLNLVGSVAYYFREEIEKIASQYNVPMGKVIKDPIDGLIEHYA